MYPEEALPPSSHYRNLAKEHPWVEHLTSLPKRWVLFPVFPHLTTEEYISRTQTVRYKRVL